MSLGRNVTGAEWDAAFTALYPPIVQDLQLWWDLGAVPDIGFSIFLRSPSPRAPNEPNRIELWPDSNSIRNLRII
jgi:hypothetical protein